MPPLISSAPREDMAWFLLSAQSLADTEESDTWNEGLDDNEWQVQEEHTTNVDRADQQPQEAADEVQPLLRKFENAILQLRAADNGGSVKRQQEEDLTRLETELDDGEEEDLEERGPAAGLGILHNLSAAFCFRARLRRRNRWPNNCRLQFLHEVPSTSDDAERDQKSSPLLHIIRWLINWVKRRC